MMWELLVIYTPSDVFQREIFIPWAISRVSGFLSDIRSLVLHPGCRCLRRSSSMSYQPTDQLTTPGKWSSYMLGIYTSRKGPQPLGTVALDDIEERAKEKLKEYPGK